MVSFRGAQSPKRSNNAYQSQSTFPSILNDTDSFTCDIGLVINTIILYHHPSCRIRNLRHSPPQFTQTGRHRPAQTPYGRNQQQQNGEGGRPIRTRSTTGNLPSSPVAGRASRGGKPSVNLNNTRRQPVGTQTPLNKRLQDSSHAKLSAKLGGEDMKDWLKARFKGNGVMDMSVSCYYTSNGGSAHPGVSNSMKMPGSLEKESCLRVTRMLRCHVERSFGDSSTPPYNKSVDGERI